MLIWTNRFYWLDIRTKYLCIRAGGSQLMVKVEIIAPIQSRGDDSEWIRRILK